MDFHKLLQVATDQQNNLDQQKKVKPEKKPSQHVKIKRDRPKGVISANVKAFLERKEREEKKKEEEERRKKEELLQKRDEERHGKKAKAMASRTKDNLQFYTQEKLNRFVAEEKEREQKQREKEERKYQKRLEKEQLAAEGKKRKRRTKLEIAKDKGLNLELQSTVGVKVQPKKKEKEKRTAKQPSKPTLDFNALIQMAQAKQNKPGQVNGNSAKSDSKAPQPRRPMTKEEKERWERTHTKEYQLFLKKGGKRPEFPGAKKLKETAKEQSSRESSPVPISSKSAKSADDSKKQTSKGPSKLNEIKTKVVENKNMAGKRIYLKGDLRAGTSKESDKSKPKKLEQSSHRDIPSSPEPEVNETVIQCGPTKSKGPVKRRNEETSVNPFDRIIERYETRRPPPAKKYRQVLESDSEEEYDSEMDDFIDDEDEENDYSSAIRDIFGYDKKKYRYEDDDVSDMETNYASIMKEEARSAKLGYMEDLEDIRREEEENKRKAERKKMREKELRKMKKKGR